MLQMCRPGPVPISARLRVIRGSVLGQSLDRAPPRGGGGRQSTAVLLHPEMLATEAFHLPCTYPRPLPSLASVPTSILSVRRNMCLTTCWTALGALSARAAAAPWRPLLRERRPREPVARLPRDECSAPPARGVCCRCRGGPAMGAAPPQRGLAGGQRAGRVVK